MSRKIPDHTAEAAVVVSPWQCFCVKIPDGRFFKNMQTVEDAHTFLDVLASLLFSFRNFQKIQQTSAVIMARKYGMV